MPQVRFISTHLDGDCLPFTSAIQQAQAREILAGPGSTMLPVVLVGDMNSPADGSGATYNDLLTAGFDDVWSASGMEAGATCCQADDVLNSASLLDRRIDLVLFRGDMDVDDVKILGEDPGERTASGLWPSDHAGLSARLSMPYGDPR